VKATGDLDQVRQTDSNDTRAKQALNIYKLQIHGNRATINSLAFGLHRNKSVIIVVANLSN